MTNYDIEFIGYNYKRLRVAMTSKIPDSAVINFEYYVKVVANWFLLFSLFGSKTSNTKSRENSSPRTGREQILRPESRNSQI